MDSTTQRRPARVTGKERTRLVGVCARRYAAGWSIRAIAAELGRSYALVYILLDEGGVTLRPPSRSTPEQRSMAKARRG